jgi:hypothetical protein
MTIATRGSWNLADAVKALWDEEGLEDTFRGLWDAAISSTVQFFAFNDTQARPAHGTSRHPLPYCIYEQWPSRKIGGSSGSVQAGPAARQQYEDVNYQFTIYANSKEDAKAGAKLVAAAFDQPQFTLPDDGQIIVTRESDFSTMHDDRTWSWSILYRIQLDCAYAASSS